MTTDAERNELLPYTFNFAEALLIAEIQAHFYNFLVGVCGELLLPRKDQWTDEAYAAKFDDDVIKSKPYPDLLPGPPELAASEQASSDDVVKNLSEMRMYSWYGSPGDLDLQTVGGLIRARVADAEDGSSFLPRHFRGNMSFTLAETIIAELKAEIEDKVPFNHYFDFRPQANDPNGLRIPRRTQILRTEISTGQRVGCELDLVLDAELKRAIDDDDAEKHLAVPHKGRFEYPSPDEEMPRELVQLLKSSEENLKAACQAKAGESIVCETAHIAREPPKMDTAVDKAGKEFSSMREEPSQTLESESSMAGQSLYDEMQAKLKSLAVADGSEAKLTATQGNSAQDAPSPPVAATAAPDGKIRVKASTLETLRMMMFEVQRTGPPPGELAWTDLRSATVDIGFWISKGAAGSAWDFHPNSSLELKPNIPVTFHDPHPRRKLRAHIARKYGRRLHRRYDWTLDSFTQR
ncbi:hypothetical protein BR93DRAFT_981932 [Coniochaeta sp. PMI_546]|nr:hypothetical protein BR93DRAFT_981932 [Coniochaeta sp. PMI_546]